MRRLMNCERISKVFLLPLTILTMLFAIQAKAVIPAATSDGIKNVIRDYGAVGDGVVDDTAAIQDAIDDLNQTNDTLFFPAGTYKTTSALTVSGKQNIHLLGRGAKIICNSTTDDAVVINSSSYITMVGFFIMNHNGGNGLTITSSPRTTLEEIKIWDCKKYNLYTTSSWWTTATNCYFRMPGIGYNAVYLGSNSNNVSFTNCMITAYESTGNTAPAVAGAGGKNVNFISCDVSNSTIGIKITLSMPVIITGCYFEGNGTTISVGDASSWPIFIAIDTCWFNITSTSLAPKTGIHLVRGSNISIRNSHFSDGNYFATAVKAENTTGLSRVIIDQSPYMERVGTRFDDPGHKIKMPSLVDAN